MAEKQQNETRLLSVEEVAELLGVSKRSVFRLADIQKLPAAIRLGRSVRWDRFQLEKWIADGCPSQR
jgi:excisionase family DNA binding protein